MIKRPTCDVCKKEAYLTSLKEEFQTGEIKNVCDACGADINEHYWKIRELTRKANASFLRRFISEKRQNIALKSK